MGFILAPNRLNSLQPHKRPMHTLVPCMVLKESKPFLVLGCIGGGQQTQGLLPDPDEYLRFKDVTTGGD